MQGQTVYFIDGETRLIKNEWAQYTEKAGTTVSSSSWEYSGSGTLSGAVLSGTVASVKLAASGFGTLSNTVVLGNGEVLVNDRYIEVA